MVEVALTVRHLDDIDRLQVAQLLILEPVNFVLPHRGHTLIQLAVAYRTVLLLQPGEVYLLNRHFLFFGKLLLHESNELLDADQLPLGEFGGRVVQKRFTLLSHLVDQAHVIFDLFLTVKFSLDLSCLFFVIRLFFSVVTPAFPFITVGICCLVLLI